MHEGLNYWQACREYWPNRIGINRRMSSVRIVYATKVTCDSQNVFEVSGQRGVPPHGVIAGLQMFVLGSCKEFHSLRKCWRAQESGEQDCGYKPFSHRILPSQRIATLSSN